MGIWIEFRCENRGNESAKAVDGLGKCCESHSNSGPMMQAGDTQADVLEVLRYLARYAKTRTR